MPTSLFNGSALRNARRRHGLTQAELARLVGQSTSTIGRLERYGGNPRADTVARLAEAQAHGYPFAPNRCVIHRRTS